jgi:ferric-dicitrate binding protein FerR (iron transport regulator)
VTKYKGTTPMGRRPENHQALSGAERQARYRARLIEPPTLADRAPAKPRPPTRPRRWHAAVTALVSLQAEYAAWLDALPEATRDTATGGALQAIVDLDLDELRAIQPPRGFGRD